MRRYLLIPLMLAAACAPADDDDTTGDDDVATDVDGDGYDVDDCDDTDAAIHPGAAEVCDGVDNDCSGIIDDGLAFADYAIDADGDGYGDSTAERISSCAPIGGSVADTTDCNDAAAAINPGATETCDGVDEDCDSVADDGLTFIDYYPDVDGDTYGDSAATPVSACSPPADLVTDHTGCDDSDVDNWAACATCVDDDGDGAFVDCDAYTTFDEDCDDSEAAAAPSLTETCDTLDNDCDGDIDEGVTSTYSVDLDGDGYGAEVQGCADPDGAGTETPGDCDDANPDAFPGNPELCDGFDTDCDPSGPEEHAVPGEYATVQAAFDGAADGDTICIGAGTWTENLVAAKSLQIEGAGSDHTFLDGGAAGRTLLLDTGAVWNVIRGLTIQNGLASTGAGLRVSDPTTDTVLEDVRILDNRCEVGSCLGAGVWATGIMDWTDVTLQDNEATIPDGDNMLGAGLYQENGYLTGVNVDIIDNASTSGGSIWIAGGGLYTSDVVISLSGGQISGNSLTGGQTRGPALATDLGSVLLDGVLIEGNTSYGDTYPYSAKGAVHVGSPTTITHCIIANNDADGEAGTTILGNVFTTYGLNDILVEHSTITGNTANGAWSSLFDSNSDDVVMSHVIAYDNDGGSMVRNDNGTTTFDYCLLSDTGAAAPAVAAGAGNITSGDPLFVDAPAGDYHLMAGSPAIDAGDPAITDGDGSTADLGAYGGM